MSPVLTRKQYISQLERALGNRSLYWAGIRTDDAKPLADLRTYAGSFSILGPVDSALQGDGLTFETISGMRPDLETWDIQDHRKGAVAAQFKTELMRRLSAPSALVAYRPSGFLSSASLARSESCSSLSLFGPKQNAFEHKPWVETELSKAGIQTIPWSYLPDEEIHLARRLLAKGPAVIRRSRTSGGEGMVKVEDESQLLADWPRTDEGLTSVAPFLENGTPINVGAVVWRDGVTVHHPSVQLIGLPSCVQRPFGYCGNDFAAAANFDDSLLDEIENATCLIGNWLRVEGYLGTFGVDFLLHDGNLLFTEINARFQGSSAASARLSAEDDETCLYLEHLGAFLGMEAPSRRPLRELTKQADPLSQIVVHSPLTEPASIDPAVLLASVADAFPNSALHHDVLTSPTLETHPGAVVGRLTTRQSVTGTGYDLDSDWLAAIEGWRTSVLRDLTDDASSDRSGEARRS